MIVICNTIILRAFCLDRGTRLWWQVGGWALLTEKGRPEIEGRGMVNRADTHLNLNLLRLGLAVEQIKDKRYPCDSLRITPDV
jgi:hypothetical protein